MRIHALPVAERALGSALALGPLLAAHARAEGVAWMAASVALGPAIVLGALQRAGRVVDLDACSRHGIAVVRRATTGTAVSFGEKAILWTLALPHVAALAPDATPRTLLNRNVRGFLEGFRRAGAIAHYFGREWIALQKQPAAVLGYDVDADGVVLIEVLASWDGSIDLPADLAAPEERVLDRYAGKKPIALAEIFEAKAPREIAAIVLGQIAERANTAIEWASLEEPDAFSPVTSALDPIPHDFTIAPPVRVPIGWIDVAGAPGSALWIGGDVLAPRWVMREIARRVAISADVTDLGSAPVDGARLEDLVAAAKAAIEGNLISG